MSNQNFLHFRSLCKRRNHGLWPRACNGCIADDNLPVIGRILRTKHSVLATMVKIWLTYHECVGSGIVCWIWFGPTVFVSFISSQLFDFHSLSCGFSSGVIMAAAIFLHAWWTQMRHLSETERKKSISSNMAIFSINIALIIQHGFMELPCLV